MRRHAALRRNVGPLLVVLVVGAFSCKQALAQAVAAPPGPSAAFSWTTSASDSVPLASPETALALAATPPEHRPSGPLDIVRLKYADVSEVVGLLTANQATKPNDSFAPQEPAFGSSALQGAYPGGVLSPSPIENAQSESSTDPLGQTIDSEIGIDRRLNAIILRGPPDEVADIKGQIEKLDVPVDSVLLETVFVELTQTGARNVGLDFNNTNNQIATVAYSFAAGGFPGSSDTSPWGGLSANLQAAVYAQIAKGNGRIVSRPRIAAESGSTAKIVTGDALPILTSIALTGVNAVQQEVQYVNVGVTLQIAPRVSEDGFVTSHVFAVVSSVTGYSQGYPTISQREASTLATVHDGDSFVIGGLTQESELSQHSRVPIAGDLPAIGRLFQVQNASKSRTELYIMVTPHIVHGRHCAPPISEDDLPPGETHNVTSRECNATG